MEAVVRKEKIIVGQGRKVYKNYFPLVDRIATSSSTESEKVFFTSPSFRIATTKQDGHIGLP